MVKVAKSRVADRNIGLPAFQHCYSLVVALNRLAIGGICNEKKNPPCAGGGMHPPHPPSGSAPAEEECTSVRLSVCPSVRHTPVLYQNEEI